MFMKRVLSLCLAVLLGLVCFGAYFREEMPVGSVGTGIAVGTSAIPPKVLHKIRITAGEDVVYGVLFSGANFEVVPRSEKRVRTAA